MLLLSLLATLPVDSPAEVVDLKVRGGGTHSVPEGHIRPVKVLSNVKRLVEGRIGLVQLLHVLQDASGKWGSTRSWENGDTTYISPFSYSAFNKAQQGRGLLHKVVY